MVSFRRTTQISIIWDGSEKGNEGRWGAIQTFGLSLQQPLPRENSGVVGRSIGAMILQASVTGNFNLLPFFGPLGTIFWIKRHLRIMQCAVVLTVSGMDEWDGS